MIEKFTHTLSAAYKKAERKSLDKQIEFDQNLLMFFVISEKNATLSRIFNKFNLNFEEILHVLAEEIDANEKTSKHGKPTTKVKDIIKNADRIRTIFNEDWIYPETLFYSFIDLCHQSKLVELIISRNVDLEKVKNEIFESSIDFNSGEDEDEGEDSQETSNTQSKKIQSLFGPNPILDKFATNLNKRAWEGEYISFVDFNNSLESLSGILSRKRKSNVIIVGEPGTGKTTLVELLALEIVTGNAPPLLSNKVIYSVNLGAMLAGTQYRGQFEQRLQEFIEEAKRYSNIILFFDEIHTLMGAGASSSSETNSLDASNMLKPELARGTISVIGATTMNEYRSTIQKDGALNRRFEMFVWKEPNAEQMMTILNNGKGYYETHHNVFYSEESLKTILDFCDSYVPHRRYPDKAIDALDQIGAEKNTAHCKVPQHIKDLENEILQDEGAALEKINEFDNQYKTWVASLRGDKLNIEYSDIVKYFVNRQNPIYKVINNNFINRIRKDWVGQNTLLNNFYKKLLGIKFGIFNSGIVDAPKSFLFYGEAHSGKTTFLNLISKEIEGVGGNAIYINGMEFNHFAALHKFTGHNAYKSGNGTVCDQIILEPNSVLIIDNIEESCSDFIALIQRIIQNGKITNSSGEVVDFSNIVLIISATVIEKKANNIGFSDKEEMAINYDFSTIENLYSSCKFKFQIKRLEKWAIKRIIYGKLKRIQDKFLLENKKINFSHTDLNKLSNKYNKNSGIKYIDSMFNDKIEPFILENIEKPEICLSKIVDLV